ncbi:guanylate kinase [Bariatricus sp. SGI.154]|uniref:guanylate kinase n=1 Tax=Bariatricus sp. SGI.154 TaxID=3420549 RepID=UPI003D04B773
MGKIYYMMGKSSSGKDTLFKEVKEALPELKTITLYTTRPIREGEQEGVEYFFVSEDTLNTYEKQGKIIEFRAYDTVHGVWKYATIDDGQVDLENADYLVIGTLESYDKIRRYYGADRLVPIYIEVEDGERLMRALKREQEQEAPKYAELCRRFLADTKDFSEENLKNFGIQKRFKNDDRTRCLEEIIGEIRHGKL